MKVISDTLTVAFDSSLDDEVGMCVSRVVNGKIAILKMELGEQADILYRLLTEQMTKAEIKAESEDIVQPQHTSKNCEDCKYTGNPPHEMCKCCVNKNRYEPKQRTE